MVGQVTEVMGVFGPMDLHSKTPAEGLFDSNVDLLALGKIEDLLSHLAPPKWPEEVFGKIDRKKAEQGKALFMANCAGCHNSYPYTWTEPNKYGKRFIEVGVVPQKYVGTDPGQFEDLRPYAITGQLGPYLPPPFKGEQIVPTGVLYFYMTEAVLESAPQDQFDRRGESKATWLQGIPSAASDARRVQGSTARRSLGHTPIHA